LLEHACKQNLGATVIWCSLVFFLSTLLMCLQINNVDLSFYVHPIDNRCADNVYVNVF